MFSSKQDQDRQKRLAQQRLVAWQQKDRSELTKVQEQLYTLETGAKPEAASSTNIGALQVRIVISRVRDHLHDAALAYADALSARQEFVGGIGDGGGGLYSTRARGIINNYSPKWR